MLRTVGQKSPAWSALLCDFLETAVSSRRQRAPSSFNRGLFFRAAERNLAMMRITTMPQASFSTKADSKTKGPGACGRLACRRSGICHAEKRKHLCHSPAAQAARDAEMNARLSDIEVKRAS
jgi:hypothetical protein